MAAEQDQSYKETWNQGNQQSVKYTNYPCQSEHFRKFPLAPMGVLAPHLRTLDVSARPPIDTSGNFLVHMSAESPLNTSPNPSEVIS